jgi:hypothetical protein
MDYRAEILADSINPTGDRLTTLLVTFPRFILAEVNTHRVLSRNFESSRAIPPKRRIAMVEESPFIPEAFGRNRPGMQATEMLADSDALSARVAWLDALRAALLYARRMADIGVHKQLVNRILEPFSWVTGVISATEWENFFALRCHPDAQPEFQRLAFLMRAARAASEPVPLLFGHWHLPLVARGEAYSSTGVQSTSRTLPGPIGAAVSAARCARVSTLRWNEWHTLSEEVSRAEALASNGHMSPLEHPAVAVLGDGDCGNFRGFWQLRKQIAGEAVFKGGTNA